MKTLEIMITMFSIKHEFAVVSMVSLMLLHKYSGCAMQPPCLSNLLVFVTLTNKGFL